MNIFIDRFEFFEFEFISLFYKNIEEDYIYIRIHEYSYMSIFN